MSAGERRRWFHRHPRLAGLAVLAVVLGAINLAMAPVIPGNIKIRSAHYHHDLVKNLATQRTWGRLDYTMATNSLGFKDAQPREVPLTSERHRVLFIGDSFTEGSGVSWAETFVGRFAATLDPERYEVLNAGASSYSPKLYFHKVRYLLEELGLRVDELRVYVDVSDPQDEILYEAWEPAPLGLARVVDSWLMSHVWMYYAVRRSGNLFKAYDPFHEARGRWPEDEAAFEEWGRRGLGLATEYMGRLHALCQRHGVSMSVAVYPWPAQIEAGDLRSPAVVAWERFCADRGIPFVDHFPSFLDGRPAAEVLEAYFIPDDVHWNPAGHALIADRIPPPRDSR